jgi:hypothetical protein
LPAVLKEEGFESKALGHDLLCSAVLFGDWLALKNPPELIRVAVTTFFQQKAPGSSFFVPLRAQWWEYPFQIYEGRQHEIHPVFIYSFNVSNFIYLPINWR